MQVKKIADIKGAQDGAIWGDELFRFDDTGRFWVYDISEIFQGAPKLLGEFTIEGRDKIIPHSNAVCFGWEYYSPEDEYPLLYSNVYNNYAKCEDQLIGVLVAYRIKRLADRYTATPVQLIRIGFCEDEALWKMSADAHGPRPYGNFVVDRDKKELWAFVMRNKELGTRYFRFAMPSVTEGGIDEKTGLKCRVLDRSEILSSFDCSYHHYLQGACFYEGKIYSTEGFGSENNPSAIRVIDPQKQEEKYFNFMEMDICDEPEMVDFHKGKCIYSDAHGKVFQLDF